MRTLLAAVALLLAGGCVYEVPLTAEPTRNVDERLLGDWVSADGRNRLRVRKLDEDDYIVALNDLLFRGRHADVAGLAFASLQDLDGAQRKYAYVAWDLSSDGRRLTWRAVSRKVVPETMTDPRAIRARVEDNRANPALLGEAQDYVRAK